MVLMFMTDVCRISWRCVPVATTMAASSTATSPASWCRLETPQVGDDDVGDDDDVDAGDDDDSIVCQWLLRWLHLPPKHPPFQTGDPIGR